MVGKNYIKRGEKSMSKASREWKKQIKELNKIFWWDGYSRHECQKSTKREYLKEKKKGKMEDKFFHKLFKKGE
jgi:hypothetical protein